eukprot:1455386-Prymnesium_polylepis.1
MAPMPSAGSSYEGKVGEATGGNTPISTTPFQKASSLERAGALASSLQRGAARCGPTPAPLRAS